MCKPACATLLFCQLLLSVTVFSQGKKFQNQVITLKRVIEREHYAPRPVNDAFSAELFDHFMERPDPYKLYLTADDAKLLGSYRTQLDEELNGRQWSFLDKALPLYRERLKKADTLINALLQKPLDLNVPDKIAFGADSLKFAASEQQWKQKWQRWLKFRTLEYLAGICDAKNADAKTCLAFEPQAREKTKAAELRAIKKLLQHPAGYEAYIVSIFNESMANLFDPHTSFMPPAEKEAFETGLGTEGLYFGLSVIENEKGEIELAQLMPGSPAWRCGELNQGDVIVQLAWEGKEAISTEGATAEEVSGILDLDNRAKLNITVRKTDGMLKTVALVKEKISNEDNMVKGFLLKGEKKIGYIYLPGFYTSFEGDGTSSCANDVAKEIVKLKKENIQALILDVRYNGGGSMQEALDMAGIFIEDGPLALIKDKTGKTITLRDMNRGTIYDGPLLLMVNGQSASASELLAAVLQDYNRAVVAGGNTFGKGSAQVILPLDTNRLGNFASRSATPPEHGFVKLTIQKFYRVNGSTTQHKGVQPDIELPEIFDGLDYSESSFKTALPADTTARNKYYKPLPPLPLAALKQKSTARVAANSMFEKLRQAGVMIQKQEDAGKGIIPLKWADYYSGYYKAFALPDREEIKKMGVAAKYEVDNTAFDKQQLGAGNYMNTQWKQRLAYDIYVQEACNILNDLIQLTTKPN